MKLLMLRGLPASGKSTYAKELVAQGGWLRVNNDDLRETMHNGKWSKHNEKIIRSVRKKMIQAGLAYGDNVVVDNLNLTPKHKKELKEVAEKYGAIFEIKNFNTSLQECIRRDAKRPNGVGEKVIKHWYDNFVRTPAEQYVPPKDKPTAIICDIDGTLAHMTTREGRPFEWHRVGEDAVDETIADIVRHYYKRDILDDSPEPKIIILSGRDGVCRPETEAWLLENNIPYDVLFMRTKDDNRKDSIIKRELFDTHIKNNYRVMFILDDRDQVVEMWREMGLKVLQVAPGNF